MITKVTKNKQKWPLRQCLSDLLPAHQLQIMVLYRGEFQTPPQNSYKVSKIIWNFLQVYILLQISYCLVIDTQTRIKIRIGFLFIQDKAWCGLSFLGSYQVYPLGWYLIQILWTVFYKVRWLQSVWFNLWFGKVYIFTYLFWIIAEQYVAELLYFSF